MLLWWELDSTEKNGSPRLKGTGWNFAEHTTRCVCVCTAHLWPGSAHLSKSPNLGTWNSHVASAVNRNRLALSPPARTWIYFLGKLSVTPLAAGTLLSSKGTFLPHFAQTCAYPQAGQNRALELMKKICYKLGIAHWRCQKAIKFWLD